MFALIDCNNFFVSCERIFRPELNGRPVVVLSSNDGCAVARSTEAKALGIPMGAPAFKYHELFKQHDVVQFSGNFELYGDISRRLVRLLTGVTPRIELYSVDESFLDLSELAITDYRAWATDLRARIWREIGIPVSVGIAPTKTLAKLASHRGKKDRHLQGVLSLAHMPDWLVDPQLDAVQIEDVWGVGRRLTPQLHARGIHTALDLKRMPRKQASQHMGVHGRQMVLELNGTRCLELAQEHVQRKSVAHGRTLGQDTSDSQVIRAAISSLTARATRKLRDDGLLAGCAELSVTSSRFKPNFQRYTVPLTLHTPSADGGYIAGKLSTALFDALPDRAVCHRINVQLYAFTPQDAIQTDLLGYVDTAGASRSRSRLQAVDAISDRFGKNRIGYAAEKLSNQWRPKHKQCSPRYTTQWSELPVAQLAAN